MEQYLHSPQLPTHKESEEKKYWGPWAREHIAFTLHCEITCRIQFRTKLKRNCSSDLPFPFRAGLKPTSKSCSGSTVKLSTLKKKKNFWLLHVLTYETNQFLSKTGSFKQLCPMQLDLCSVWTSPLFLPFPSIQSNLYDSISDQLKVRLTAVLYCNKAFCVGK